MSLSHSIRKTVESKKNVLTLEDEESLAEHEEVFQPTVRSGRRLSLVIGDNQSINQNLSLNVPEVLDLSEINDIKHVIFVSDVGVISAISNTLETKRDLVEYNDTFLNRTPSDLFSLGYRNLHVNISDVKGRVWLQKNALKHDPYVIVVVHSGRAKNRSKWSDDIKDVHTHTKAAFVQTLVSHCIDDLIEQIVSVNEIHSPPTTCDLVLNKMFSFLGTHVLKKATGA